MEMDGTTIEAAGDACSAPAQIAVVYLIVRTPTEDQLVIIDDGDELTLGRAPGAGILLPGRQVSREHARVSRRGGTIVIEDRSSHNGTYVNGEPITAPTKLRSGSVVRIGQTEILVAIAEGGAGAATPGLRLEQEIARVSAGDGAHILWISGGEQASVGGFLALTAELARASLVEQVAPDMYAVML
jgi:predicted RecA/RadA family phage recombinase